MIFTSPCGRVQLPRHQKTLKAQLWHYLVNITAAYMFLLFLNMVGENYTIIEYDSEKIASINSKVVCLTNSVPQNTQNPVYHNNC